MVDKKHFNLIDEPWIKVITIDGQNKEVSLKELFNEAHNYLGLGGDSKTQDFAVIRIILAILNTVFSRFNEEGVPYSYINIDENYFLKTTEIDEDDLDDYKHELMTTWKNLYDKKHFPKIVNDYLEKQRERFYLVHDKYPFMQINKKTYDDICKVEPKKSDPDSGKILYKTINRSISESNNKISLFSPKSEGYKNKLSDSEIIRWIITFHGYTGSGDKTKIQKYVKPGDGKNSIGTIYQLGGIMLKGKNLFETLMFNLILIHPDDKNNEKNSLIQKPLWELDNEIAIKKLFEQKQPRNLSELFTWPSRILYLDYVNKEVIPWKLPSIYQDDSDCSIETFTIWDNKKKQLAPKKHKLNDSLWKSFGLITEVITENDKLPGIKKWFYDIKKYIKPDINSKITIVAISMEADNNATSMLPTNEILEVWEYQGIRKSMLFLFRIILALFENNLNFFCFY